MQGFSFLRDARYFQIAFQLCFLTYGIGWLHWKLDWPLFLTYIFSGIAAQWIAEKWKSNTDTVFSKRLYSGLPSVMISMLSLCLLLKTNYLYIAALAAVVAISSKYIFRINGQHFFNPSALAIVAMVLPGWAWFSPGQWGNGAFIFSTVMCLGIIVTTRVQKLDTSISFILAFGGLLFVRQIIYLGWPADYFLQSISTGSLLLFTFFMISDPKTVPNHAVARILFCVLTGVVAFYLATFKFINGAPIYALVLLQPLVPLLNYFFKHQGFHWTNQKVQIQ